VKTKYRVKYICPFHETKEINRFKKTLIALAMTTAAFNASAALTVINSTATTAAKGQ